MPTLLHPPPSLFYIALNAPCQSSLAGQNLELDVFPLHYILADTQDMKYAPPATDQACTLHNNIVLHAKRGGNIYIQNNAIRETLSNVQQWGREAYDAK